MGIIWAHHKLYARTSVDKFGGWPNVSDVACRSYGSDHLELCFSQLLVIHIMKIRGVVSLTVALVSKYGEVDLSLH